MEGDKKEKKRRIVYCRSGERSTKNAEAKVFQNESSTKHILSKKLSGQRNAEYFVFGSSGY
jgi:hypothetical protein